AARAGCHKPTASLRQARYLPLLAAAWTVSRRRSAGRRARISVAVLDSTQPRNVLLVLSIVIREDVPAGAVGDEIQFLGACRIGRGLERGTAGFGDGTRGQPVDHVSVVRGGLFDFALEDGTAERPFAAGQAIDDRRIRLQPHPGLEPIDED